LPDVLDMEGGGYTIGRMAIRKVGSRCTIRRRPVRRPKGVRGIRSKE